MFPPKKECWVNIIECMAKHVNSETALEEKLLRIAAAASLKMETPPPPTPSAATAATSALVPVKQEGPGAATGDSAVVLPLPVKKNPYDVSLTRVLDFKDVSVAAWDTVGEPYLLLKEMLPPTVFGSLLAWGGPGVGCEASPGRFVQGC